MSTDEEFEVPTTSAEELVEAAARPPEPGLGTCVVGYDGTVGSRVALQWAVELAGGTGRTLRVVSCWTYEAVWDEARADHADGSVPPESKMAEIAQRRLTEAVAALTGGTQVECVSVHSDEPGDVLVAQSASADLLFVGSRGRSGIGATLLGSVSGRLLRDAACPVVVVPQRVIAVRSVSA
ncbi:MAG TPA: universal stress protein [Actinomycetales bacterium]|jgi:nucleotide-binding universal stress UspA family protein